MELCWFFKPLYVIMEEVPDVANANTNVMPFITGGFQEKAGTDGYSSSYHVEEAV
jgi:hypothetical protein